MFRPQKATNRPLFTKKKLKILVHIVQKRNFFMVKGKGLPQQAEVAQGVPGRLRPRIFLTFGTTMEVGRQP